MKNNYLLTEKKNVMKKRDLRKYYYSQREKREFTHSEKEKKLNETKRIISCIYQSCYKV